MDSIVWNGRMVSFFGFVLEFEKCIWSCSSGKNEEFVCFYFYTWADHIFADKKGNDDDVKKWRVKKVCFSRRTDLIKWDKFDRSYFKCNIVYALHCTVYSSSMLDRKKNYEAVFIHFEHFNSIKILVIKLFLMNLIQHWVFFKLFSSLSFDVLQLKDITRKLTISIPWDIAWR